MGKFGLIDLIISEGAFEILEFLKESRTAHFNDFRVIKNNRTGKIFSANTISNKLKELEKTGAIERVVSTSPKGRNVVAYKITQYGEKALEIAYRLETELRKAMKK